MLFPATFRPTSSVNKNDKTKILKKKISYMSVTFDLSLKCTNTITLNVYNYKTCKSFQSLYSFFFFKSCYNIIQFSSDIICITLQIDFVFMRSHSYTSLRFLFAYFMHVGVKNADYTCNYFKLTPNCIKKQDRKRLISCYFCVVEL